MIYSQQLLLATQRVTQIFLVNFRSSLTRYMSPQVDDLSLRSDKRLIIMMKSKRGEFERVMKQHNQGNLHAVISLMSYHENITQLNER